MRRMTSLKLRCGELAGVLDEAAEDGVGDAGHRGEDSGGSDLYVADGEARRDARVLGHGVIDWIIPAFLLEGIAFFHSGLGADFPVRFVFLHIIVSKFGDRCAKTFRLEFNLRLWLPINRSVYR